MGPPVYRSEPGESLGWTGLRAFCRSRLGGSDLLVKVLRYWQGLGCATCVLVPVVTVESGTMSTFVNCFAQDVVIVLTFVSIPFREGESLCPASFWIKEGGHRYFAPKPQA